MARAKRTDRAEARRRHRQAQLAQEEIDEGATIEGAPSRTRVAPIATRREAVPPRPGVLGAIRSAAAPAPIRADLAALRGIALHSKAIWVPGLLILATGILVLIPDMSKNVMVVLLFQAFLYPPPMAAAFLAGLLAPRAAWLAGGLLGVLAALVFSGDALLLAGATGAGLTSSGASNLAQLVIYAWAVSPIMGIGVGAFAGFYRRFLRMTGPASGGRTASRRKPAARR